MSTVVWFPRKPAKTIFSTVYVVHSQISLCQTCVIDSTVDFSSVFGARDIFSSAQSLFFLLNCFYQVINLMCLPPEIAGLRAVPPFRWSLSRSPKDCASPRRTLGVRWNFFVADFWNSRDGLCRKEWTARGLRNSIYSHLSTEKVSSLSTFQPW